nr:MAG TPA: portal protein [Caudoviricetes sp.]
MARQVQRAPQRTAKQSEPAQQTPPVSVQQVENRWKQVFSSPVGAGFGGVYPGGYMLNVGASFVNDPYLLNSRIKQLSTRSAFTDRDKIEESLKNPENNEFLLREATHSMIYLTYPLYRLQMLYEGILKYRSYIEPRYVKKEEMNTPRFKSDWKLVDMWQKKLNPQKQFRRIVAEVVPEGKRAYYLRQSYNSTTDKENVNYVHFQVLPSDWYKIIKHSTDSYEVVAFNFAYFWQAGTELGQFPAIFTKYYSELMDATTVDEKGHRWIDPYKTPEDVVVEYNQDTMSWFYWKELPADECFVFSFTESDDLQISPFASLLLQAQDLASYSLLQQQLLTVPLYSMLLGVMPLHDDNKSGNYTDDFRLSPEAVNAFEQKVNSSMPPGTTYNIVPSENNVLYHFQEIPNAGEIYNKGLQQLINTSGASTLMTTTEKPSVAQVAAGKIIETRFIDRMYDQFAWACNITLEKMYNLGDLKFHWQFYIHGDAFSEEKEVSAIEKSLSMGQVELLPKYLSYHDKTLLDAVTDIDWVEVSGIYDKFRPLVNTFGISNKEEKAPGRPKMDLDKIENDNTANSVDSGTNTSDTRFSLNRCAACGGDISDEYYPFCSEECKESYIEEHHNDYE